MKLLKSTGFLIILLTALFSITAYSQSCEVITTNVISESGSSLTFDVYLKNTGASGFTYSHGSYAWNYSPGFLNGGTPAFSLVPGFSDFPAAAQPPSALIGTSSIIRTSSNLPGANGIILPGQTLRLYRFRFQTSAASFSGTNLQASWKTAGTPYTRIFTWNSGTGLPEENLSLTYRLDALLLEENFDFSGLLTANGWSPHSGTTNQLSTTSGLTYPNYPVNSGNAVLVNNLGGEDVNKGFASEVNTNGTSVYFSALVNVTEPASDKTGDYFMHIGNRVSPTSFTFFASRVFAKVTSGTVNFGLSNTSTGTYGTTPFSKDYTYLLIVKYTINNSGNDTTSLWIVSSGIPYSEGEAGTPEVVNTVTAGQDILNAFAFRQGSSSTSPQVVVDGVRVGLNWSDILPPAAGTPQLTLAPSTLSGFTYLTGSGPSAVQSYNLSGGNLTPLSGSITISESTNYEISDDSLNFGSTLNIPYSGGALESTPVYVRLKAGLGIGSYNGEFIANVGGGDTAIVTCNGSVYLPEPDNHVTAFSGAPGIPAYASAELTWIDASGATVPDGYLIKGSYLSPDSISAPVDGSPVSNGFLVQNVVQGTGGYIFSGLNGDRSYYFKIYPYTNSGTLINYKTDGSVPQTMVATTAPPALPVVETFNYPSGSTLTSNGWLAHSSVGTNPITVSPSPLVYAGYFASGIGKSASLNTSGEDVNRAFDSVNTGSVYASFLVNVASAQAAGDYFFHISPENHTSLFYAKVFVKDSLGSLGFGVSKRANSTTGAVYTDCIYSPGVTYLIAVKYTFNTATAQDDEISLWVNPVLNGIEPPADLVSTDLNDDALSLGMFALRQGSSSSAAAVSVAGIRVADTWIPVTLGASLNLTSYIEGFWNGTNMVSDDVTVELRNTASPYAAVEQQIINLNSSGTGTGLFFNVSDGIPYYISVKHRNSVETWSASPVQFTAGVLSYDFSTSAAQAYGNNMVLKNTKWCMFSGDVNQDGKVDLQDMAEIDNSLSQSGYLPADVNGDGTVSSLDMDITENNSDGFAAVKKPGAVPEIKIKAIQVNPSE